MKILVIGGSYFLGRWFVELAHKDHEVTVLNRGNIPVRIDNVKSIIADRTSKEQLEACVKEDYDCIVDFCGYNPGDISLICDAFAKSHTRYLFVSTIDTYQKNTDEKLSENAPLETSLLPGQVGAYINGKVLLEKELRECADRIGMKFSIIRPAIIYGPANYAPREKVFFDWIQAANQIIVPEKSEGQFQFIYVVDLAKAILMLCQLEETELQDAYNIANEEIDTYDSFVMALHEATGSDFQEIPMSIEEIEEKNIPLPFPLTPKESLLVDVTRFKELGIKTISLVDGLWECKARNNP